MAYVYKHIRKDNNEVFYIGIGTLKNYKRVNSTLNRNTHWINITNKVGYESEIIDDNITWEVACELEKYWISYYGRADLKKGNLVNLTDGGDGTFGKIHSIETRQKQSKAKIGNKHHFFNKKRKTHSDWMLENHPNKKPIIQYDLYNNVIKEWDSARHVDFVHQINYKNISACCRGKRKTAGGYIWKFKN
jgi:hypothetical protein